MRQPHRSSRTGSMTRHDFIDRDHQSSNKRVLVVVFLRGGADAMTLVPPTGDDEYYKSRPTLAVDVDEALRLDGYFSLNPVLEPLHEYFMDGELGIVHGCGSEDTTRSHFEAQDLMEHGGNHGSGWLGRFLRAQQRTPAALSAVAIGTIRPESLRGAPAGAVMQTIRDFTFGESREGMLDHLAALYAAEQGALGKAGQDTLAAVQRLRAIRADSSDDAAQRGYPNTTFGRGLREIVRLVNADVGLEATTVDLNGWDTHFVQARLIGGLMTELGQGLSAFWKDLGHHRANVDVVVMTEFGRRLRENTSFGTDHGSGGALFVLGKAASTAGIAGKVKSGFESLDVRYRDEVGDMPANINYRDVLAPILRSHSPTLNLSQVFPAWTVKEHDSFSVM